MTISTQSSQVILLGNGATTVFNFPFVGAAAADIQVTYIDANNNSTVLSPSQYTLVLNAASPGQLWGVGGTVTYPTAGPAIANGTFLVISRIVPFTQTVTISNQGDFAPQVIEQAMDLLEMQVQQIGARTGRYRGTWATGLVYYGGDVVVDGANGTNTGNFYMCALQNTSGVWATDLAAGDWVLAYIGLTAANIAGVLGYTPMRGSNNLSELTNAVTARGNLGLGTISTQNANNVAITGGAISGVTFTGHASLDLQASNNLSDLTNSATARSNLGVAIGTNVQAHNAVLDGIASYFGFTSLSWYLNGSGNVTSAGLTGTGNFVFSASPTLTGTITAAAANFSGSLSGAAASFTTLTTSSNVLMSGGNIDISLNGTKYFNLDQSVGSGGVTIAAGSDGMLLTSTGAGQLYSVGTLLLLGNSGSEVISLSASGISISGGSSSLSALANGNVVAGSAAIPTNSTTGMFWIPSCAGTPTGVAGAPYSGAIGLLYDSSGNKLFARNGASWKSVTLS